MVDTGSCRPFYRGREGMNIGEGAAMLVLEDFDRARRRGARIYAEMVGHGLECEAYHPRHRSRTEAPSRRRCARALADAAVSADCIDHVNAHGTATPQNDRAEARGIWQVFGDRAAAAARDVGQVDGGTLRWRPPARSRPRFPR